MQSLSQMWVHCLRKMTIALGTWFVAIDVKTKNFPLNNLVKITRNSSLSVGKLAIVFQCSTSRVYEFPSLRYKSVYGRLPHLSLPKGIPLIQCTDDMLIGRRSSFLDILAKHLHVRKWKMNSTKIQRSTSLKFLGAQRC